LILERGKKNNVKANALYYIKDLAAAALPFAEQRVEDTENVQDYRTT
jgi:hypothetical protein